MSMLGGHEGRLERDRDSGSEYHMDCDNRMEKYPQEKWCLKMVYLIRGSKDDLGIKLVVAVAHKVQINPPNKMHQLWEMQGIKVR